MSAHIEEELLRHVRSCDDRYKDIFHQLDRLRRGQPLPGLTWGNIAIVITVIGAMFTAWTSLTNNVSGLSVQVQMIEKNIESNHADAIQAQQRIWQAIGNKKDK